MEERKAAGTVIPRAPGGGGGALGSVAVRSDSPPRYAVLLGPRLLRPQPGTRHYLRLHIVPCSLLHTSLLHLPPTPASRHSRHRCLQATALLPLPARPTNTSQERSLCRPDQDYAESPATEPCCPLSSEVHHPRQEAGEQ